MKATLTIIDSKVAARACEVIRALGFADPHEVIIRPKKRDRSGAQNRLYWQWLTLIAGETGQDKESLHEAMKRKHLVLIFSRDNADYGEMISAMKKLRGTPDYEVLARQITRLTSTTSASVEQFAEYLNEVERNALELGIVLPHPDDLYWEAMGQ